MQHYQVTQEKYSKTFKSHTFVEASNRNENKRQLNPFRRKYALKMSRWTFIQCETQIHKTRKLILNCLPHDFSGLGGKEWPSSLTLNAERVNCDPTPHRIYYYGEPEHENEEK
jgi:hypothetical protein